MFCLGPLRKSGSTLAGSRQSSDWTDSDPADPPRHPLGATISLPGFQLSSEYPHRRGIFLSFPKSQLSSLFRRCLEEEEEEREGEGEVGESCWVQRSGTSRRNRSRK
uniref:Uncharacterized protein n=1 Tax=Rhizophora mucronata TaxID=61149 RepID=A0A2P2NS46_RHIMU